MKITFEAKPIGTAPKDREIMLYCPRRGAWRSGRYVQGDIQLFRTGATYATYDHEADLRDPATYWAEISDMAPNAAVPKEGEE